CGDHVELLAEAGFRRPRLEPRGEDHAGERRAEAGDDIGAELNPPNIDAGQPGRQLAAADRVEVKPEARASKDERAGKQQYHEDDEGDRDAEDVALADDQELIVVDDRTREILYVMRVERQADATDDVKHRQGDDEGGDSEPGDEKSVHGAG